MYRYINFICYLLIFTSCSNKPSLEELKAFAATEKYPADSFLDTVSNKSALVIVAHDDDDCLMAGTIAKLHNSGWKIKQLTFSLTLLDPDRTEHPSVLISDGAELILPNTSYRIGVDTIKYPYVPISKERIMQTEFKNEEIEAALIQLINKYNPSVIFTLDNEMGGYGNPEHVYISQLVVNLLNQDKISADRIYQGVYTNHMEQEIIDTWLYNKMKKYDFPNPYTIGKKIYGIDGMPEPDVEINITDYANEKMSYMLAYHEDARKNIRKFVPYFEEFDASTYFSVFDREFFRVIEKRSES